MLLFISDIHIFSGLFLHPISLFFIVLIFLILLFQVYNAWLLPRNVKRNWGICLLVLVLIRNLVEGLFQKSSSSIGIPLYVQNFLGHGFGYIIAAFFPIYWYVTIGLKQLKKHAKYGPFILSVPVILIYCLFLPINGDLRQTRTFAYAIPFLYGSGLISEICVNLWVNFRNSFDQESFKNRILVLFSVTMWLLSPLIGFFYPQWVEDTIINSIFLLVSFMFLRKTGLLSKRLLRYEQRRKESVIEENAKKLKFSPAELVIAKAYLEGVSRKKMAEKNKIVLSTIDWHLSNIHTKAGTKEIKNRSLRHTALVQKLTTPSSI